MGSAALRGYHLLTKIRVASIVTMKELTEIVAMLQVVFTMGMELMYVLSWRHNVMRSNDSVLVVHGCMNSYRLQ